MESKFELSLARNGGYHFRLLGTNGQILLNSAGLYSTKVSALNGINAVRRNASDSSRYLVLATKNHFLFRLSAANGQNIGVSEFFQNESSLKNVIELVKSTARSAEINDLASEGENDENLNKTIDNIIRIGSIRTFFSELEKFKSDDEHFYYFRGHSDIRHTLKPSIYRDVGWINNEDILFKELVLRCPSDFNFTESTFQILVKMQHYSLPTRLLDITSNPLIALYFASSEKNELTTDGEVIIFKVPKKELKYYDSDTVSVISNISHRPKEFTLDDGEISKEDFNKLDKIDLLLHDIRREKPYFRPLIKKEHLQSVVCVKPKLDNARILKQDGAFFLFGIKESKLLPAEIPTDYILTKSSPLIISSDKKGLIRDQLKTLGITQGTIYPEIEKVAEYIKDEYKNKKFE